MLGAMIERTEDLVTKDGPMGVHVVQPDGDGPFPVVVFFHHGPGLDPGSKQTMARIAEWGYLVASHDRYHREEPWYVFDGRGGEEAQQRFWSVLMGTTDDMVETDLQALLAFLDGDPAAREAPMGCVGYCIGARSVLRAVQHHGDVFRAGIALHPSFCTVPDDEDSPHLAVPSYTGSLYVGFGSADTMQPASDNVALIDATNALDKGEAEVHDGADHGYAVFGPRHHEAAADRSYERARAMFDRELG